MSLPKKNQLVSAFHILYTLFLQLSSLKHFLFAWLVQDAPQEVLWDSYVLMLYVDSDCAHLRMFCHTLHTLFQQGYAFYVDAYELLADYHHQKQKKHGWVFTPRPRVPTLPL